MSLAAPPRPEQALPLQPCALQPFVGVYIHVGLLRAVRGLRWCACGEESNAVRMGWGGRSGGERDSERTARERDESCGGKGGEGWTEGRGAGGGIASRVLYHAEFVQG